LHLTNVIFEKAEEVPRRNATQWELKVFYLLRKIILMVFGEIKGRSIKKTLEGPIND